jgi:hypothetical protein
MQPKLTYAFLAIAILAANTTFAQNVLYQYTIHPNTELAQKESLKKIVQKAAGYQKIIDKDTMQRKAFIVREINKTGSQMTEDTSYSKLLQYSDSLFFVPQGQKGRDSILKVKKDTLQYIRLDDTATLTLYNNQINEIKNYNTLAFLARNKPPKTFFIADMGKYNLDTLNTYFYNQNDVDVFQNAAIQNFSNSSTNVSAELASFLFGPVRMGFGGSFISKGDTTKDNAIKTSIQKIITNSGNIDLNFSIPLFFHRSQNSQLHFGIFAQVNNSINPGIDSLGQTDYSKNVFYINQSGFDLHFDVASNDKKASLYFDLPIYYAWGSSNAYQQLAQSDFSMVKLQVGAVLQNLLAFNVTGPLLSTSRKVQSSPFVISLQFSPSQVAKSVKTASQTN